MLLGMHLTFKAHEEQYTVCSRHFYFTLLFVKSSFYKKIGFGCKSYQKAKHCLDKLMY